VYTFAASDLDTETDFSQLGVLKRHLMLLWMNLKGFNVSIQKNNFEKGWELLGKLC
jgi:hypothetical protein